LCVLPGSGTCENNPVDNAHLPLGVFILSNIDNGGLSGYPARDQVGQGKDTGSPAGLTQTLTPAYWWNNIDPNNSNAQLTTLNVASDNSAYIQTDRDVYMGHDPSFNAMIGGIGRGTSVPTMNCTPRVGYWVTDPINPNNNGLYVCTATNSWTRYYRPLDYPHTLQSS
jgi:hypothetical protein